MLRSMRRDVPSALNLPARVLAEEDGVAGPGVQRYPLPIVVGFAVARGDDRAPLGFSLAEFGMMMLPTCCSRSSRR
jgi:hypothetical protein